MTATNHTLAGMLLLAVVPHPVMLVVAFLSHFALDALPHFGMKSHTTSSFLKLLLIDMSVAALLLLSVLILQPAHWPLIILGGIFAASPDLMWLAPFLREIRGKKTKPFGPLRRFHSWIQWFEKPAGVPVEMAWLAGAGLLLANLL